MIFKKKNKPDEKRRFERFDFIQATFYKFSGDEKESKIVECFLNNISVGGISFDTKDEQLKENDSIKLMYKIGTILRRDTLFVKHLVRVFNNWRVGCEFSDEEPDRDKMIIRYVKSTMSK
jgi:c-di-GMP-binding flagellar brake protein YcgR